MLKELFMALEMARAARDLQQQMGAISSIHVRVDESLEKVTATVIGKNCDEYVDYSNVEKYNERTAKDVLTVWNYCFEHSGRQTWEVRTDADDVEYEFGYWKIGGVWFMVTIYE